jgi:hypothetical protein
MVEYDIWGNEIVPEPPKPKAKPKRKKKAEIDWNAFWEGNDMVAWFQDNMPETITDCADLRKAMAEREEPVGKYSASDYTTKTTGRAFLIVNGPVSRFIIVSPRARRLFNEKLRRHEERINIQTAQFKAQEEYRNRMNRVRSTLQ